MDVKVVLDRSGEIGRWTDRALLADGRWSFLRGIGCRASRRAPQAITGRYRTPADDQAPEKAWPLGPRRTGFAYLVGVAFGRGIACWPKVSRGIPLYWASQILHITRSWVRFGDWARLTPHQLAGILTGLRVSLSCGHAEVSGIRYPIEFGRGWLERGMCCACRDRGGPAARRSAARAALAHRPWYSARRACRVRGRGVPWRQAVAITDQ